MATADFLLIEADTGCYVRGREKINTFLQISQGNFDFINLCSTKNSDMKSNRRFPCEIEAFFVLQNETFREQRIFIQRGATSGTADSKEMNF